MRRLFGKKTKDNPTSSDSIIRPKTAGSPADGSAFTAVPQASQAAAQASQAATQASQVRPGEPFRSQGDELSQKNDYNGAVVMYNAALRSAPDDLSLLLSRSVAHSMSTPPRLDLALKDADAVTQLNPRWWQGWLQKGEIFLQMDNLQSAEEVLTKAAGFAQGMDRNTAQRALADVRKRQPRSLTTAPPLATEILTPNPTTERPSAVQSNLPLRPSQSPSLALPLSPPTSNTVSTTLPTLSPSTPPSTTFYTPSTAPTNLGTTAVLPGATTRQSPLHTLPTASSTPASTNQPPQPAWASTPHGSGTSTAQPFTWPSSTHPPAPASSHRPTSKFTILRNH
jgi:hypothetical protein